MAKSHWNWTKKAVLTSLMLGASVLVSTDIRAEEKEAKSIYLGETFDAQVFDLTNEAAKLQDSEELDEVITKVKKMLSQLSTEDLMKLVSHTFINRPSTIPDIRQKIFNLSEDYKTQAQELYDFVVNDETAGHLIIHANGRYGLKYLGLGLKENDDEVGENDLFPLLLNFELFRRSKNYENIVNDLKTNDKTLTDVSKKLASETEKSEKLEKEISNARKESQALRAKKDELTDELNKSKTTNKQLEDKISENEKALTDSAKQVETLNEEIKNSTEARNNLQSQLESKQKDLTDLQQRFNATTETNKEEKAKLQAELDSKKAEVDGLKAQVAESSEKLQALEEAKKEAEAKVNSLTSEKAEIEAKLKDQSQLSEEEKAKLKEQLADVQAKIAEKDASIKSLEGQLDALKQQEHDSAPSAPETPKDPEVKPEDKPSTPKKPEIKPAPTPAIPEVNPNTPHSPAKPGKAHPAAPKAHHAATPATPHMAAQDTTAQLPQTGDSVNPFFTVAALSIMASAGVLATKRKED